MENSGNNISLRRIFKPEKRIIALTLCSLVVFIVVITSCLIAIRAPEMKGSIPLERKSDLEKFEQFPYVPIELPINYSVDPCIDFYKFSCGGWPDYAKKFSDEDFITPFSILKDAVNNRIKEIFQSSTPSDHYPNLVNSAINFYQTCVEAVDVKHRKNEEMLLELLTDIGGFPLLNQNLSESDFNWVKACAIIFKTLDINNIISFQLGIDETNASQNIIIIKAPPLTYKHQHESVAAALFCVIHDLVDVNFEADKTFFYQVDAVLSIQHGIVDLVNDFYGNVSEPKRMTITELQKEIPGIDWLYFFQLLNNETLKYTNSCINENETILVNDIMYLKAVVEFLNSQAVEKKPIGYLFSWYVINELLTILPSVFQKYSEMFGQTHEERAEVIAETCYQKVNGLFSDALSYLYIDHAPKIDEQNFVELMNYMKISFNQMIESSSWLDEDIKTKILHKLEVMHEIIGFSDIFKSKLNFDQSYNDFPVMTDTCVKNIVHASKFFFSRNLRKLKTTNVGVSWEPPRPVTYVGAYYAVEHNTIVIPLAMHNKPFYYQNGSQYLTYGALGSIIGHEISHGYDSVGRERDENGTLSNWWTNNTLSAHDNQLKCFENQFKSYFDSDPASGVDSVKTLVENVADSTGLEQAYIAYKNWEKDNGVEQKYSGLEQFSSDQMFFLAFASQYCISISEERRIALAAVDPHSPSKLRVQGSVSNSEAFAKAFGCRSGSPMNPIKKCKIW